MSRRTRTGPRDEVVPALAGMRNYYSAVQKLRAFVLYEFYASYGVILFVFPGARCVCRVNFSPFFFILLLEFVYFFLLVICNVNISKKILKLRSMFYNYVY